MNAPVYVPVDTKKALGGEDLPKCNSRSLFLTRFSGPESEGEVRKTFFHTGFQKYPERVFLKSWLDFIHKEMRISSEDLLFGRLGGRLALHLSGGTMENANILLNRFGLPYIPGSGVKGCARRCAIAAIQSMIRQPESATDILKPIYSSFKVPDEFIAKTILIFGWGDNDWKCGKNSNDEYLSDLHFAAGDSWEQLRLDVAQQLKERYRVELDRNGLPKSSYAGAINFLPAHPLPLEYPERNDLELDVTTCHHRDYYSEKMKFALDTEAPVPVYFPTVAAGITFSFPITLSHLGLGIASSPQELLCLARVFLQQGLSLFGLGAKTAAGYGWFEVDEEFQQQTKNNLENLNKNREEAARVKRQKEEKARIRAIEEAKAKEESDKQKIKKKKLEEAIAKASTPEEKEDVKIMQLSDDQFRSKLQSFCNAKNAPTDEEKAAIVRALRNDRLEIWNSIKHNRKGDWPQIQNAIRALSNKLNYGKMP